MAIFNIGETANDGISIGNTVTNVSSNSTMLVVGTSEVLIDSITGSNIGDMSAGGGLAAAFNGNTNQVDSLSAKKALANAGYVGKTLAVASAISKAVVYAPYDTGFTSGRASTLYLYGKAGAAPVNETDGTLLANVEQIDSANIDSQTLVSDDLTTVWNHTWVTIVPSTTSTTVSIAEVKFYKAGSSSITITATGISVPDIGFGNSTVNSLANSIAFTLANSTVTYSLIKPTVAQVAGQYYLKADGSWSTVTAGSATPAGANTHVQYNDSGVTGGVAGFTFDEATNNVFIANTLTIGTATINSSNYSQTSNNTLNLGGTAAAGYQTTAGLAANVAILTANSATFVPVTNGMVSNSTGLWITANAGLLTNATGLHIGTANGISVTTDAVGVLAGPTLTLNTTGVHVNSTLILPTSLSVGDSTANAVANLIAFTLANSTVTYSLIKPTAAQVSSADYYPASDGSWKQVTGGAGTPGGSNTYIQYNDSGVFNGLAGFTFNETTNNVFIANTLTVGSATINSSNYSQTANNALNLGGTAAASYQLNSTLAANVLTLTSNNSNWLGGNISANSTGAYPISNTSGAVLGNTISRFIITSNTVTVSGGVSPSSNTLGTALGSATQRWVLLANTIESTGLANVSALNVVNQTNTATFVATTTAAVGANVIANTTAILIGNSTVNAVLNQANLILANSTVNTAIKIPTTTEYAGAYYLKADGSWSTVTAGSAIPAGANTHVQYNDSGVTAGGAYFTIDKTTNNVFIANTLSVANVTISNKITANGSQGSASQVLSANSTGGVYWATAAGGGNVSKVGTPADDQVGVWTGDGTIEGTAGFTFSAASNNAFIANTLTVGASGNTINSTVWTGKAYTANDSTNLGGTAAASYQLNSTLAANVATMTANNATWHGTSIFANSTGAYPTSNTVGAVLGNTISRVIITGNSATFTSTLAAGDTTVTGFVNATTVVNSAAHTIGATLIANTLGVYHTGIVNAASHTTTGFLANATHVVPTSNTSGQTFGNTISRWVITANSVTTSGGASPDSNTLGTALGTTTQRWVLIANTIETTGLANVSALNVVNQTNTATFFATTSANVGANVQVSTAGYFVGNTTVNLNINSTSVVIANSTVNTQLTIPTSGQYSATNYFLHANGSWVQVTAGAGGNVARVYQSFTATDGQTVFTVSGGYTVGQVDVFYNGTHLTNTEYTQDGSIITLTGTGANLNALVEVAGYQNIGALSLAPAGSNTQVQFNDSGILNATAGFTFNNTTNNVLIANTLTIGTSIANSTILLLANSTVQSNLAIGSLMLGNSTVNSVINSTALVFANSTVSSRPGELLLANGIVSSAATLDFVLTSYTAYKGFKIVLMDMRPASTNVDLLLRFSTNGGSTYISTGTYSYGRFTVGDDNATGSNANSGTGTSITMLGSATNSSSDALNAVIYLLNPSNTTRFTKIMWTLTGVGDATYSGHGMGTYEVAQDTDAIRFFYNSGNVANCVYGIYGIVI